MRFAIVDDRENEIYTLTETVEKIFRGRPAEVPEIRAFHSGEDLLSYLRESPDDAAEEHRFDLIFLDIIMKGMNGIDVAREIRKDDTRTKLVFITTSNDFAAESYEVKAEGYLLKPYSDEKIAGLLDEIMPKIIEDANEITFPGGLTVNVSQLMYSEFRSHYAYLHLKNESEHKVRIRQSELELILTESLHFYVCNRGLIANFDYVRNITDSMSESRSQACRLLSRL